MTDAPQDLLDSIGGEAVEVARYSISAGDRVLLGRRRPAGVELHDVPLAGGRRYCVDRGLRGAEAIGSLVNDYLTQAGRLDACPMDPSAIDSILGASDQEELMSLLLGQEER
jgi:hypothetical protein